MLDDFVVQDVDVDGTRIRAAIGGDGPPLLMLHATPRPT